MEEPMDSVVEDEKTVEPAKKKLKRHFFLSVIGISLLMILAGQIVGEILMGVIGGLLPSVSNGTLFLFRYLSFIGIDILVIVYCLLAEKEIFHGFLHGKSAVGSSLPREVGASRRQRGRRQRSTDLQRLGACRFRIRIRGNYLVRSRHDAVSSNPPPYVQRSVARQP